MNFLDFFGERGVVVGHRGDPEHHPDNSLAGIRSGLAAGGRVEIDVRQSADGRLVLSHDPLVGSLSIAQSSWAELRDLQGLPSPICLLDEALALGGAFDLEIKNLPGGPTFDPHGRLALLVAARARPGDLLTSFYWPDMDKVQDAGTARTGLLIPESGSVQDAISYAVANGHQVIAPHHTLIDKGSMGAAEASDLTVIAWTVNEHAKARELSNLGVSAIITDRPHVLAELGKVETS